ncbi:ABC transporter ATP-binding protein [Allorhizocola rhizosphaerae]|uniref:ABC transporter ATP-binding protein n=1 Tax=Allorhizocola rhizosphaerae TaxID=1872709 RepID=UPI001FE83A8C|nr:ATP-binding cassette domain-containing protein [Allorhizocola rhizosphaerae]
MSADLVMDEVTVGYRPGVPVLRGLSLAVRPGEVLAVTGPSGAGKTTLLRTLAGLLAPAQGTVTVGGGEPVGDRDSAVKRGIVLIPQDNGLATMLTAAENIQVVLLAGGVPPDEALSRTAQCLELVGLSGQHDQLVEELSGGQQQRVAIARGLALRGDFLLADEVTSELDAANRQRALDLLLAEAARGAAVAFATHDPDAAAACHAELHLVDGQVWSG